jgi:hypothetical protein
MPKKITKKSAKSSNKLKRTLGWLKPTSTKQGALLFAIIFAIIGGSYMAYNSFASTTDVKVYGQELYTDSNSGCGLSRVLDASSSSKRSITVLKMANKGCASFGWTTYATGSSASGNPPFGSWAPVNMKFCIYARGDAGAGDNKLVYMSANVGTVQLRLDKATVRGSKDYQKICTAESRVPAGISQVGLYIANSDPNRDLYFAWSSLEYSLAQ